MKKGTDEILYQAEAQYKDLLLRKTFGLRILETVVFIVGMLLASAVFNSETLVFKISAFVIAFAVVGLAPFVYKVVLRPRYTLTKSHLVISISGKERSFPLNEVEAIIEGRHMYRLSGKREALMVSRDFLAHLNERIFLFQRKNKRR
ncbi:hypothetical protein EDM56_05490 [Brevibacillus fluminis]|uniref:YcxB family protein n=1 Tax=Brevibacillus fluminis TaxID=511487 RepID=A0A3M8DVF6_9BACL|nr:hypothetical protein [Brevibacillus fluminis]RNB91489.1 hypothetical protein EDM56_05490 [Brevibacillus fluminis]